MPPSALLDLSKLDLSRVVVSREEIYEKLPHRHEFMLLDGIVHLDLAAQVAVGFHDVREDAWWTKGHIPGRPLFPGVLMIETAAHLASYVSTIIMNHTKFLGFGGIDDTKFRDAVTPPARFYIVGKADSIKPRRTICSLQGFVQDRMVFETKVTGLSV
jgi:3-hydroxyacyl-[acyl-carrier-protein] dehydratase